VFKHITWSLNDRFFDGNVALVNTGILRQFGSSPGIAAYAGAASATINDLSLNTFGIARIVFNGANSKLIINNNTPITGNFGTSSMAGFTLGTGGGGNITLNANIQVKEIILRNVVDSPVNETNIYNYLSNKYLGTDLGITKQITYCKSVNDIVYDSNTVAWYRSDVSTATMTIYDPSTTISRWNDYLGSGHDLIQNTSIYQPTWSTDGVLFDGVDDYLKTTSFTFTQPGFLYTVLKQVTYTANRCLFDGNSAVTFRVDQVGGTPNIRFAANLVSPQSSNFAVNTWGILRCLGNGSNGKFQVNNTTAITGNFGESNIAGFTLGSRADASLWSNIQVKEIIFRKISDISDSETTIYNYLKTKYGL
jgi:hypothetical protein